MPTLNAAIDSRGAVKGAKQFDKATDQMQRSAKGAGMSIGILDKRVNRLRNEQGRFVKQSGGMTGAINTTRRSVLRLAGAFAGTAGLTVAIAKAVSIISNFNDTMATLQGVTRATEENMARFRETARELGATTRFSANEAGEGLLFLARAGFTANEAITALPATLDLAIAGNLGLGRAADIASNTVAQFGLEVEQTAKVGDTFVNTANSANVTVEQLAESLKFVGPVAGALGRSLDETSAAVGVLGDAGIQASLAGTQLRQVFAALLGPTAKAQDTIRDLGLTLDDVNPETNTLAEIFTRLRDAELSSAQALDIFGRRAASGVIILRDNIAKLKELTQANREAIGVAKENAEVQADTLGGSLKSLRSAIEELALTLGDLTKGPLRAVIDTMTQFVRIIAGVKGALSEANFAATALVGTISGIGLALAGAGFIKFVGIIFKLAFAFRAVTNAVRAFTIALARNPITIIAVLLSILVTALLETVGAFGKATDASKDLTEAMKQQKIAAEEAALAMDNYSGALARFARAQRFGTLQEQANAIRSIASNLKDLSVELSGGERPSILKDILAKRESAGLRTDRFVVSGLTDQLPFDSALRETLEERFKKFETITLDQFQVAVEDTIKELERREQSLIDEIAGAQLAEGGGVLGGVIRRFTDAAAIQVKEAGRGFADGFMQGIERARDAIVDFRLFIGNEQQQQLIRVEQRFKRIRDSLRSAGQLTPERSRALQEELQRRRNEILNPSESRAGGRGGVSLPTTLPTSPSLGSGFQGFGFEFRSQGRPIEQTARNTKDTADNTSRMTVQLSLLLEELRQNQGVSGFARIGVPG